MNTVITLLYGEKYNVNDVHHIYEASKQYNHVCFVDEKNIGQLRPEINPILITDIDGTFEKIKLFQHDLGNCLYLDLDIIIQGSLDPFFAYCDEPTICETYWKSFGGRFNSSVIAYNSKDVKHIYEKFSSNSDYIMTKYSDNDDWFLYHEDLIHRTFPRGLIYSFLFGVDERYDTSPRAYQIKKDYPIVLLNGQKETTVDLKQKYYDALSLHKMG